MSELEELKAQVDSLEDLVGRLAAIVQSQSEQIGRLLALMERAWRLK